MARRRRSRQYPFIPIDFLITHHNRWIDHTQCPSWRKIAIDSRQMKDLNIDDLTWVLEQRIIHFEVLQEMARKKQIIRPKVAGIKDPFPSAPKFPGKYELRFYYRGKMNIHIFAAEYAAWHFLKAVIRKDKPTWVDPHTVAVGDDVLIKSKSLDLLINYTPSPAEREWVLPIPYVYYAHAIATGEPWTGESSPGITAHATVEGRKTDRSSSVSGTSRRNKHRNNAGDAPKRSSRQNDGTTFGIQELVDATGRDASRIRGALRKSSIDKPAAGWMWPVAEKEQVLASIKKFLK